MSMRLFIGGARGSRPAIGAAFSEFGGDTTSLLVVGSRGERLVLDAGTGMYAVAGQLAAGGPGDVAVLLSHYHLDHVMGLTMNPLFYKSGWAFRLAGPMFADGGVREAVNRLLSPPYWPITCDRMSARMTFAEFPATEMALGSLRVRGLRIPHPGGCLAYRIDDTDNGGSLVYATDLEWASRTPAQETEFLTLCRDGGGADGLFIDAHFARADAKVFAGMGHTCWEDCVEIAESAGVRRLLLAHHAPDADDGVLRALEKKAKDRAANAELARAGQWLAITD